MNLIDSVRGEYPVRSKMLVVLAVAVSWANALALDEPPTDTISAERQLILRDLRTGVAAMKVAEKKGATLQPAKVVEEPIFSIQRSSETD